MPLTDFPNRFDDLKQVYVGDQLLDIDSIKYHKQFVILHFKQYPVREEAMRLTGQLVSLDRSQAAPLAEGEYYAFDIIGLSVYDMDGGLLGKVAKLGEGYMTLELAPGIEVQVQRSAVVQVLPKGTIK